MSRSVLFRAASGLLFSGCLLATGCHSAFVQATVRNDTAQPIALIEVDYPSASFGRENLAPGASFPYRFKILGDGPSSVTWTDTKHQEHTGKGPALTEGQEGTLTLTITATGATWDTHLKP